MQKRVKEIKRERKREREIERERGKKERKREGIDSNNNFAKLQDLSFDKSQR